jgi:hypothetical protein
MCKLKLFISGAQCILKSRSGFHGCDERYPMGRAT